MKQIYIDNFKVDISRSEVHRENDIVSLEPKVLQVLLFLIEHQGEVVSRQSLLDEVWPGSIVETNALQRCIGQLRKAFLDDAKQQRVIATYPKNGYSLLLPAQQESSQTASHVPTKRIKGLLPGLGLLILLIIALLFIQTTQTNSNGVPDLNERLITDQNQALDLYAIYSPNEEYVVYTQPDSSNTELKNLWLHDLNKETKIQLNTIPMKAYEATWSADSKHFSFIESDAKCSSLKQVSLPQSEKISIPIINLLDCRDSLMQSPQWISSGNILMIETKDNQNVISNYDIELARAEILFQHKDLKPQRLAYSAETNTLAITLIDDKSQQKLQLLSLTSNEIFATELTLPLSSMNELWYPVWNQQNKTFIIATSEGVYTIALDGSVSELNSSVIVE